MFLRLVFATKTNLGYDPSVKRVKDPISSAINYEYTMSAKIYVTVGPPLFDFQAEYFDGRGTRVWKVHEQGRPDVEFALKDLWIFSDTSPEGEILHELRKNVPAEYQNIFLTMVDDDWVKVDDGKDDQMDGVIMRGVPEIIRYVTIQLQDEDDKRASQEKSGQPMIIGSQHNESHGHTPQGPLGIHNEALARQQGQTFLPQRH